MMTNYGGTQMSMEESGRFMFPQKLFGYQTSYFITSKKDIFPDLRYWIQASYISLQVSFESKLGLS